MFDFLRDRRASSASAACRLLAGPLPGPAPGRTRGRPAPKARRGQVGHPRLPRRRPVAPRQLRPEAGRPGGDPRQVQADRHQRARPPVGEMLPHMAQTMDKVALVRSGAHDNDHHETATNWVLSGRFGSAFGDYPAMGAVVAHETGFSRQLPPYVAVPRNPSFTWELGKSAFLGGRYESFKAGDPNAAELQGAGLCPGRGADRRSRPSGGRSC